MSITTNGYVVTSEEEYYNFIIGELKNQFPNMSESPSNLLAILARIMARNENTRDYDTVQRYSYAYVSTAVGFHLSKAVRTAGISRILGRNAVGDVLITKDAGSAQIIIPPETLLKSNELIYKTTNQSTLIISTATETVEVISDETGEIYNIPNGSELKTVENISGIESIFASTDIEGGGEEEIDAALRARYYQRVSGYSNSSLKGIIDKVSTVINVTKVSGDENNSDIIAEGLIPHSFIIYANGGTDLEVATAIMESKPAGIQMNGDITVPVDVYGTLYDIKFSRFVDQYVYYYIEVAIDQTLAPVDFEDQLKQLITDYTSQNLSIIAYELSNHISQSMESVNGVKKLNFALTPDPTVDDDLIAEAGKILFTDETKISVVVL